MKLKPVLTIYLFTCFLFNVQQSYAQERLSDQKSAAGFSTGRGKPHVVQCFINHH